MKKPARTRDRQNRINAALMNSLGQHKAAPVPEAAKTSPTSPAVTRQAAQTVAAAPKASGEPALRKPDAAKTNTAKKGTDTRPRSLSRHSILLNKKDTAIIRRIRMSLLAAGHDNVNMSRILRMGLRLLPEEDSVLLESYGDVSAEDMRLKR